MTPFALLAASTATRVNAWPDAVDSVALTLFAAIAIGLPGLGYAFMVLDIRRYLRSLRRALVVVAAAATRRSVPNWARRDRPPCLEALDLSLPCTEEQVMAAYRRRVKELHPDHGGDLQQFLRLQKHFEQALYLVRQHTKARTVSVS